GPPPCNAAKSDEEGLYAAIGNYTRGTELRCARRGNWNQPRAGYSAQTGEIIMNQILPYPLWPGHAGDRKNFQQIFPRDIRAIVQLAVEEPPYQLPRELIYCRFPLSDGTGNETGLLHSAISTVALLLRQELPTLVCCSAGMSRSPAVAAAALARLHQEPPDV